MGEAQAIIANLPPWMQVVANVALLILTLATLALAVVKGAKVPKAPDGEDHEHRDAHEAKEFLTAGPVKDALAGMAELGVNARLQTEALKTIAAAHTAYAKLVEPDFLELRIFKAVQEQLREERRNRGS